MMHRMLMCTLLLTLAGSAQPAQRVVDETGESWSFSSDEGGSGSSYLGVDITDVTAERLSALKLKEEDGAEITMVDQDAPAGKAGLHEHDVIVSLNGSAVESAAQLRRMIKETPPGRVVTLGISRDGQPLTIKVQLADRRKSNAWTPGNHEFKFEMPQLPSLPDMDLPISVVIAHSSLRSGLMVENITPQLGDFFGVKGGKGVLVRSVEKGSRSEKAGFHAGDVVVKVNDQPVHDTFDFTRALRTTAGGTAAVTVVRDKREQNLTLTLPEGKDSGYLKEDSLDIPEINEETEIAISRADELALLNPDMMKKVQDATKQASEAAQRVEECWQGRKKEIEKNLQGQEKTLRDQEQKMRDREKKIQREIMGEWTEI
jgi:serine protease Do